MTRFYIDLRIDTDGYRSEDQLEAFLEAALDELYELDGAIDPDLTARLSTGEVMFTVGVDADNGPKALAGAMTLIRTAIHAAKGATPGWGAHIRDVEQTVRPAENGELVA